MRVMQFKLNLNANVEHFVQFFRDIFARPTSLFINATEDHFKPVLREKNY